MNEAKEVATFGTNAVSWLQGDRLIETPPQLNPSTSLRLWTIYWRFAKMDIYFCYIKRGFLVILIHEWD